MIHFDDLLVARVLNTKMPEQRQILLRALDSLQEGESQRGLLAGLVAASVLNRGQAQYVHETVERTKRGQAVGIYAHMLTRAGVDEALVRSHLDRLGEEAGIPALAQAVLANRAIAPQVEQQVRFQAKMINDRDQAAQVQAFLASRPRVPTDADRSVSAVYTLPALPLPVPGQQGLAIDRAHVAKVTQTHIAVPQLDLDPPAFDVAEWIDTSDARTGERINGYRIVGRIGAGAMGVVYLADHPDDPTRPVALKLLAAGATEDAIGRFKREILANGFFSHDGIIDVYDAGHSPQGEHFLAMEFFDGEDLAEILENEQRLDPITAIELARQLFEVLGEAHQAGIVHRDIKPANILVSRDGHTAKLMDFGIAIVKDLGEFEHMVFKTVEGGSTGTPQFMSPEQAAGDKILPPSDVYSLAIVLYEALSGRLPFESESVHGYMTCHMMEDPLPLAKIDKQLRALPKELHALLEACLDKAPDNRPTAGDAAEILARLQPALEAKRGGSGRLFGFLWRGRGG